MTDAIETLTRRKGQLQSLINANIGHGISDDFRNDAKVRLSEINTALFHLNSIKSSKPVVDEEAIGSKRKPFVDEKPIDRKLFIPSNDPVPPKHYDTCPSCKSTNINYKRIFWNCNECSYEWGAKF